MASQTIVTNKVKSYVWQQRNRSVPLDMLAAIHSTNNGTKEREENRIARKFQMSLLADVFAGLSRLGTLPRFGRGNDVLPCSPSAF